MPASACTICGGEGRFTLTCTSLTFGLAPTNWHLCIDHMKALMTWQRDQVELASIPEVPI
jgi:hypothetical protein